MFVKNFLQLFIRMVPFWLMAIGLYYLFRFFGLDQTPGITLESPDIRIGQPNGGFLIVGLIAALIYTLVEAIGDSPPIKRQPFGLILLVKAVLTFIIILFVSYQVNRILPLERRVDNPTDILGFRPFWSFVIYFSFMSILASFIRLMINMFGKGQLIRILLGKYRHPSEEKRIFLILDLKSSVAAAEKLGHIRYSKLIQECYYDLDKSVLKHRGEIYQYVGDEAVVTWPYQLGIRNNHCVNCFLDFQNELEKRQPFYIQKFGLQPQFKAGLHGGSLTVAEVGGEKKEIAFHGDVINTASRIQAACNQTGKEILVSEQLSKDLTYHDLEPIGYVTLKGRSKPVALLTINEFN